MFVDVFLVCLLNLRPLCLLFGGGVVGFFELTNDDSGDCLLVDRCWSGFFLCFDGVLFSMESLILAQDERWRRA